MVLCKAGWVRGGVVAAAIALPVAVHAQALQSFDLPAQPLADALRAVGRLTGANVAFAPGMTAGRRAPRLQGSFSAEVALNRLVAGAGLSVRRIGPNTFLIEPVRAEPASAPVAADPPTPLEELVVTARKRRERLPDVPGPVSAIGAATLERSKAVRLEDYMAFVPGATIDSARAGQTKISFRGVNNGATNATVVVYVDDTPLTGSTGHASSAYVTPNLDPSDIDQIEALRGPQGTLYGANAIGGVLRYVTVQPDPDRFSGRVEAGGEDVAQGDAGWAVRGAVNLPLAAGKAALRLSAYDRSDPGFIDDPSLGLKDENGVRVRGGRAALAVQPTDDFRLTLSALVQSMRSDGNDTVDYDPFTQEPLADLQHRRFLRDEWFSSRYRVFNATAQWSLPWASLISSTSYSTQDNGGDNDATPAYGAVAAAAFGRSDLGLDNPLIVHLKKFSQEVRLTSAGAGRLEWQVGGFYTHEASLYDQSANLFDTDDQSPVTGYGDIFVATLDSTYDEYSAFANLDYHFTGAFDLNLGARYSVDDQTFHLLTHGLLIGPPQDIDQPSHEAAFTWLINPRYRFGEDQMAYARIASGYRPGGANALTAAAIAAGVPTIYDADHLVSYEAGWKGAFLGRRVSVDLAAYYIAWNDIQLPLTLANFNFEGNGGKAHSQGVEGTFTFRPLAGLNLTANLAWNANRLDRDDQTDPDRSQAGNRLPGTPRFSGTLSADYQWRLSPSTDAFVGGSLSFSGARPGALSLGYDPAAAGGIGAVSNFGDIPIYDSATGAVLGTASTRLPGYATVDLHAGIEHGGWTLSAYVKNLTDARVISEYGGLNDPTFSNLATVWTASVLRPRTIGASVACKF